MGRTPKHPIFCFFGGDLCLLIIVVCFYLYALSHFSKVIHTYIYKIKLLYRLKNGVDPNGRSMEKPRTMENGTDRTKPWQLSEIMDAVQCRLVTMPEGTDSSSKVCEVSCI